LLIYVFILIFQLVVEVYLLACCAGGDDESLVTSARRAGSGAGVEPNLGTTGRRVIPNLPGSDV
jgi:hypothetical protein